MSDAPHNHARYPTDADAAIRGERFVFTFTSTSEENTERIASSLASLLIAGDAITLEGELGAGKTAFTRGVARALGHDPRAVSSPTFVLLNEYISPAARLQLLHADAYRLIGGDMESLGLDSRDAQPHALLIEWASRVPTFIASLDANALVTIDLAHIPAEPNQRAIQITLPASWRKRAAFTQFQVNSQSDVAAPAGRKPVVCPITGKPVPADSPTWPFFDDHARRADLGRWLMGSYRVSREATQDDLEQLDRGSHEAGSSS